MLCLRQSDVLRQGRKVMRCVPLSTREAHIICEANITPAGHITFRAAEHIIAKGTCFRKCLLLVPLTGLEPVRDRSRQILSFVPEREARGIWQYFTELEVT